MKKNKFLIAIICIKLFSPMISFSSEARATQPKAPQSWGEWARAKRDNLWQAGSQKLSQVKSYTAGFVPQSIKNTVSKWSVQTQIKVMSAIVGALALAGYNKDTVMQLFSDAWTNTINLAREHPKATGAAAIGASLTAKHIITENQRERLMNELITKLSVEYLKNNEVDEYVVKNFLERVRDTNALGSYSQQLNNNNTFKLTNFHLSNFLDPDYGKDLNQPLDSLYLSNLIKSYIKVSSATDFVSERIKPPTKEEIGAILKGYMTRHETENMESYLRNNAQFLFTEYDITSPKLKTLLNATYSTADAQAKKMAQTIITGIEQVAK
jgi:hypothetical protein